MKASESAAVLRIKPGPWKDTPEERVLDLRKDGIDCIPVFERLHLSRRGDETTRREHIHIGCIEVTYCQRGELVFESMGTDYPLFPGTVFVSRPDQPHRQRAFPKGQLTYGFLFKVPSPSETILSLPLDESRWLRKRFLSLPNRSFRANDDVRYAFQKVLRVYDGGTGDDASRRVHLRSAILQLLLSVLDASDRVSEDSSQNVRVGKVIEQIRDDPSRSFTLDELAAKAFLSVSTLIQQFKRLTGFPPSAFRNVCRIEAAKRELARGEVSLGTIALRLGFSSQQNFATKFRLLTGKTPRDWREEHVKAKRCLKKY